MVNIIGIIGQGFVGNAIYQKFKKYYTVLTYDLHSSLCNASLDDVIDKCTIIYVCLPTPMERDGSCHTGIVLETLEKLNKETKAIVVLKSTVPPGSTEKWNKLFENINIIFNPEFLTEANAVEDFEKQDRIILGGPRPGSTKLKQIYSRVFPEASIIKTNSTYAEMVKYTTNAFLATKVSFANEIYQICGRVGADYDKVIEYATIDRRLGKSHWSVPGPDGDFGFGGHCFPKDLRALTQLSKELGTVNNVITSALETNEAVRENKDWEKMIGRAVI